MASTDACNDGGAYVIRIFFRESPNEFGIIHKDLSIEKFKAHVVIM